jgi:hypothetical protein
MRYSLATTAAVAAHSGAVAVGRVSAAASTSTKTKTTSTFSFTKEKSECALGLCDEKHI